MALFLDPDLRCPGIPRHIRADRMVRGYAGHTHPNVDIAVDINGAAQMADDGYVDQTEQRSCYVGHDGG